MKLSIIIAVVTIIYSLAWLIFNGFNIVSANSTTMEVRASVYALLSLVNAFIILSLFINAHFNQWKQGYNRDKNLTMQKEKFPYSFYRLFL